MNDKYRIYVNGLFKEVTYIHVRGPGAIIDIIHMDNALMKYIQIKCEFLKDIFLKHISPTPKKLLTDLM